MTETQERFLRTILTRVPLDAVVELHLFPPIRRGTLETGVAIIATVPPSAPLVVVDDAMHDAAMSDAAPVIAIVTEATVADAADRAVDDGAAVADDDSPYADEAEAVVVAEPIVSAPAHQPRHCILTASYRHTIKGADRGKWVVDVQEEADAPLDAVEAVLRGVRHRSTEPADPELVPHETLAALITPAVVAPAA